MISNFIIFIVFILNINLLYIAFHRLNEIKIFKM